MLPGKVVHLQLTSSRCVQGDTQQAEPCTGDSDSDPESDLPDRPPAVVSPIPSLLVRLLGVCHWPGNAAGLQLTRSACVQGETQQAEPCTADSDSDLPDRPPAVVSPRQSSLFRLWGVCH